MRKEQCEKCGQWFSEDDMVGDFCETCYEETIEFVVDGEDEEDD